MPDMFEEFWAAIPKRNKPHPKMDARIKWDRAMREGAKPEDIILRPGHGARKRSETGKAGTEYVPYGLDMVASKKIP